LPVRLGAVSEGLAAARPVKNDPGSARSGLTAR
jgi:hypothetical protein